MLALISFLVLMTATLVDVSLGARQAVYLPGDATFWSVSLACLARVTKSVALALTIFSTAGAVILPARR